MKINSIEKLKIFNAFYDFKRAMTEKFMKKYNEDPESYVAVPWEVWDRDFLYNQINSHFLKFIEKRGFEDALDLAILCFFYWMKDKESWKKLIKEMESAPQPPR